MEILQETADLVAVSGLQGIAQIGDDPVEVAQHDIDRDRKRRGGDMVGDIACRRVNGKADELPRRA